MALFIVALVVGALVGLYMYLTSTYDYWKKRGIPQASGILPGVGHLGPQLMLKSNLSDICEDIYNRHKGQSMVGMYTLRKPTLLLREPELIKTVLQTHFSSFHENLMKIDSRFDPLLSKHPFFVSGDEWVTARKRLTYGFSTSRLKGLADIIKGVNKKFDDYLEKQLSDGKQREYNLRDVFTRFTGEVVANAGFGVEGQCFEDTIKPGSFLEIGDKVFESAFAGGISQLLALFIPPLNNVLQVAFIPKHVDRYFRKIVEDMIKVRMNEEGSRNDFMQLMLQMDKQDKGELDKAAFETIVGNMLNFFIDGFESSSVTLSLVAFHLSMHPEVQQKLREEVNQVLNKHGGVIDYDTIKDFTYMDQVISESQRLHPVASMSGRVCTQSFELKGSDGLSCRVEPGTDIYVPVQGLHKDPEYWKDPQMFDPDRFSDERKQEITKFTFLPFGEGPRMCVGMRMGVLQMKACLATLLRKYSLELSPKTQLPLKMNPSGFFISPLGGLWAYLKKI